MSNQETNRFIPVENVIPDVTDMSVIQSECAIYAPGCDIPPLNLKIVDSLDDTTSKYVIYLNNIKVKNYKFFAQLQWLIEQNNYLDVLKHKDVWIIFGTEYVKTKSNKDYWAMNLRPNHYFDDTTWSKNGS